MKKFLFFFFNDTATTEIYTLSLHDALPIFEAEAAMLGQPVSMLIPEVIGFKLTGKLREGITATDLVLTRSEEHTSELQSRPHLVCRLLLEKKNETYILSLLNFYVPTINY